MLVKRIMPVAVYPTEIVISVTYHYHHHHLFCHKQVQAVTWTQVRVTGQQGT